MATTIYSLVILLTCFTFGVSFAKPSINRKIPGFLNGGSRYFENQINSTIECLRKLLVQGNPDTGLPSFAPWRMDETLAVHIDNKYLWTNLTVNDVVIDGLVSFETVALNLSSLMQLDVGYHFDKIYITASYEGRINLLSMLTFNGDGIIEVELSNIDVNMWTQHNMVPPLIGDYSFVLSLGKARINITGIMGDEDWSRYFSTVISNVATVLVNLFRQQISDLISPFLIEYLSSQIGHLPFLDFLAIVSNSTCPV